MTVILGIQCKDGSVIVAADGAATFTTDIGAPTARQPVSKLSLIDNQVIFAHSGNIGMGQRLEATVRDSWGPKGMAKKYDATGAMQYLRNRFWQEVIKDEVDVVNQSVPHLAQAAQQVINQHFLVATPPLKSATLPCLIHFNWQGAPEMLTNQLPCVAMGSGQPIADPFLSFIRRVLWKNGAPSGIADGLFAAAWTLRYVIETSPAYVSPPEQIMTIRLDETQSTWISEEIKRPNLDEHFENVSALEEYIGEYPHGFRV